MNRGPRLAATSESEIVFGIELVDGLVARNGFRLFRQWLGNVVLLVQGGVHAALTLRGSDEALVGTLGIRTLIDREGVIARLGEGVNLRAPAIRAVSPARDWLAWLGGPIQVCERRSLRFLPREIGLYPLGSHHDTRLEILRGVDLLLPFRMEKTRSGWEGWEPVERGKTGMAAIGVGELDRQLGGAR